MLLNLEKSALLVIDIQEKLLPHVLNHQGMLKNCEWLCQLAHRLNVPIMISEQYPKGLGPTNPSLVKASRQDKPIEKMHFFCMSHQPYLETLAQLEKSQLILIGMEAHVCVLQSAFEMKSAGYDVFVVSNAVSSRFKHDLEQGLDRMKHGSIHLVTAEMVFFEWLRKAGTDMFKALSKEFLQ